MAYRREIALALMLALLLCGLWLVVGRLDGAQSRGQIKRNIMMNRDGQTPCTRSFQATRPPG